ncbi:MAG TPA: methyltransferase domain-containing protein [Steroidobacteraceae bacterium]|nr:methyltransferase domain-containing protein [Steroidobacteraceae bacterium]
MSPVIDFPAMKALLEARLNALRGPLRILEAGCGRDWPLKLSVPYKVTGLDLDPDALAARKDLDEAIVGDLRTAEFPAHSFDVIYSAFVLEHVHGADQVLKRFLRWLAPGGTLILQLPDRDSAYGFLTRVTPMWLHVMVYRYLFGMREAGTAGHGPYRTYYDRVVSQRGLREFCRRHGLPAPELYCMCTYESNRVVRLAAHLTGMLSGGRLAWRHNNMLILLQASRSEGSVARNLKAQPAQAATVSGEAESHVA